MSRSLLKAGSLALYVFVVLHGIAADAQPARDAVAIVRDIMRADYEADLPGLLRLFEELKTPAHSASEASRIHYWRGFARWRRAINGVNDGAPIGQMREDLQIAAREFDSSLAIDPQFVDAKAALLSSIGIQLFLANGDKAVSQPLIDRVMPMVKGLTSETQDNPRMIWVLGQAEWRTPPDWSPERVLARQDRVIATYRRGLDLIRAGKAAHASALDPTWGEPELLMNLAWSGLNKVTPDLDMAEHSAREALRLAPNWHYVRDILLPQIQRAKTK